MDISIYKIQNRINGKSYIGQTSNFNKRIMDHHYRKDKNKLIAIDIMKYGWPNFSFEELIKVPDEIADEMELLFQIQFNSYAPNGYNLTIGGQKFKVHSEQSKRKISENHADLSGSKHPFWGKHHSNETKTKMSKSHEGLLAGEKHPYWGKHRPEEVKKKISTSHLKPEVRKLKSERMSGENSPSARLSYLEICQIRNLYKTGKYKQIDLSKIFKVGQTHISRIINYQSWR